MTDTTKNTGGEMTQIDQQRLAKVMRIDLKPGRHGSFDQGCCVMEAVSYVSGDVWTDEPECCCPVIGEFMRAWNDALPDNESRNRLLRPLIAKLVGSRSTPEVTERRSYMALDWLILVHTPAWLDLNPSLQKHAKDLRDLEPIADMAGATAVGERVRAVRDAAGGAAADAAGVAAWDAARYAAVAAAWDAVRDAAGDAAVVAAWDAARYAAVAAVRDAAWNAARYAAVAAAGDAAVAAVGSAARYAAVDALKPTTEWLQQSALRLVDEMLEA